MLFLAWGECLRGHSFIISIIHGTSCKAKWYTSGGKTENSSLFDHKLQKPPGTNERNIALCCRLGPMTNRKSTARCRWEIILRLSLIWHYNEVIAKGERCMCACTCTCIHGYLSSGTCFSNLQSTWRLRGHLTSISNVIIAVIFWTSALFVVILNLSHETLLFKYTPFVWNKRHFKFRFSFTSASFRC